MLTSMQAVNSHVLAIQTASLEHGQITKKPPSPGGTWRLWSKRSDDQRTHGALVAGAGAAGVVGAGAAGAAGAGGTDAAGAGAAGFTGAAGTGAGAAGFAGVAGAWTGRVTAEAGTLGAAGAGMEAPGVTVIGVEVPPGVRLMTGEFAPSGPTVADRPLGPLMLKFGIPGIFCAAAGSTLGFGGPSTSLVGSLAAIHWARVSP